jgi:hypothetical protein
VRRWRDRQGSAPTSAELRARASENRSIVGWVIGFWFVMFLGFALWLWLEHRVASDSLSCPIPGQESASAFGQPSWQWFPPGKVCSYPGTTLPTEYPNTDRAVVGVFLIAVLVLVVALCIWSEVRIRSRLRATA